MGFRSWIARRYLVSRRRVSLVSVISALSVAGVAVGVTSLIVVLSVMNGFFDVVRDLLVSFDPHVRIEAAEGRALDDPERLLAVAGGIHGVESVAPYVEGKALLTYQGAPGVTQVVVVRGVDQQALDAGDPRLAEAIVSGAFDLAPPAPEALPGIVVGAGLAMQLGLYPELDRVGGSRVGLLSAPGLERLLTQPLGLPPQQPFVVRGLYELQPAYDRSHVFVSLEEAQRLFRMPGRVTGVELRLADLDRAGAVRNQLRRQLDPELYRVSTWYDLQRALYDVMRLEKWGATFILMLIIVVAVFNIIGSLTMIVIEKRRDLGALRAMGASKRDIQRIFILEGLFVGLLGAGIGLVLGLGLALLQQATGFVPLAQAEAFIIDAYPVSIRILDVVLITGVAILLCVLAAIYPASRAASVEPAQAVRVGA
jgi:lipoprotein-releasing system permease protein